MSNSLTKKEKGFVQDYVKTGNGTQSALKNYDTKDISTAAMIASTNIRKPKIQKAIKSIAEQIPDNLLVERHTELLNKREYIAIKDNETGELREKIDLGPESIAVSKGLDMAYKIKGIYTLEKIENKTIINIVSPESLTLAKEYEEKLKKNI